MLSFIFTACEGIGTNGNNNSDTDNGDRLINGEWYDFSNLSAKDWEGEELTEEEWNNVFSALRTCTFHQYKKTNSVEESYFKYNVRTMCAEYKSREIGYDDLFNEWCIYSMESDGRYFYKGIVNYNYNAGSVDKEWKRCKIDYSSSMREQLDKSLITNMPRFKFNDFTFKNGYYYAEYINVAQFVGQPYTYLGISFSNIKIAFENGKVKLLSYDARESHWVNGPNNRVY